MFVLVVKKFWEFLEVVFGCFDWFGLVLRNFCIKEMVKFQRSFYQIFFKNPILVLAIG